MTISLSSQMMFDLGFRELPLGETVAGIFHSLHAYEVQGFTLDEAALPPVTGSVANISYRLVVGSSINAACQQLFNDNFADDEPAWQSEHKCTPPFVLIHLGPTVEHRGISNHAKHDGSQITTYDSFPVAREELRELELKVLPSLLTALSCATPQPVRFRPIDRAMFGLTADGKTIHDIRFVASGSGYCSTKISQADIEIQLVQTLSIASEINPKVARFFHLALSEDDPLKKFLYFFLSIEIETHAVFASIDHPTHLARLVTSTPRAANTTNEFFQAQRERWTTLKDRFVWCVLCVWTHLQDADVDEFKRLKKVRDNIAHGSIAAPTADEVVAIERLASKLQLPPP